MCAHSSSGKEITENITVKLYPQISKAFQEVIHQVELMKIEEKKVELPAEFYDLKAEFESLKNYETKLVFPSVMKVFNTKDKIDANPSINIAELQKLTKNKEATIFLLVEKLKKQFSDGDDFPLKQMKSLVFLFETGFVEYKKQWNAMLMGWNLSCACFVAANKVDNELENKH